MIAFWFRLFVSTLKAWISLVILASISISLYAIFYQWYIPHFVLTNPIFFQFDVTCQQLATARYHADNVLPPKRLEDCQFVHYDLYNSQHYFKRGQLYNIDIRLEMPDSETNQRLGMFMIRLRLYDINDQLLLQTARPAVYPYRSMYVRLVRLAFGTLLHMFGYLAESVVLDVALIDQHVHNIEALHFNEITRIRVELETYREIELVSPSHLRITARLSGIQYCMYFWPITSSLIIASTIFGVLLFTTLVIFICRWFSKKSTEYAQNQNNIESSSSSSLMEPVQLPQHCDALADQSNGSS